jgi:hypothetical protein
MAHICLYARHYAIYNTDSPNLHMGYVEALVLAVSHIKLYKNQEFNKQHAQNYNNADLKKPNIHSQWNKHIHIYIYIYIYIYITTQITYISLCICLVCDLFSKVVINVVYSNKRYSD